MTSTVFDLVGKYAIEKGLPWQLSFTRYAGPARTPVDLTGLVARFELFDALVAGAPILVLSSEAGGIVLGGNAGTVVINITASASAEIMTKHLRYRLFFTTSAGVESLFMRGRVGFLGSNA